MTTCAKCSGMLRAGGWGMGQKCPSGVAPDEGGVGPQFLARSISLRFKNPFSHRGHRGTQRK